MASLLRRALESDGLVGTAGEVAGDLPEEANPGAPVQHDQNSTMSVDEIMHPEKPTE